jgi:hypothetical protein
MRLQIEDCKRRESKIKYKTELAEAYTTRKIVKAKQRGKMTSDHQQRLAFLEGLMKGSPSVIASLSYSELVALEGICLILLYSDHYSLTSSNKKNNTSPKSCSTCTINLRLLFLFSLLLLLQNYIPT